MMVALSRHGTLEDAGNQGPAHRSLVHSSP
jgi:hypothetical protein